MRNRTKRACILLIQRSNWNKAKTKKNQLDRGGMQIREHMKIKTLKVQLRADTAQPHSDSAFSFGWPFIGSDPDFQRSIIIGIWARDSID